MVAFRSGTMFVVGWLVLLPCRGVKAASPPERPQTQPPVGLVVLAGGVGGLDLFPLTTAKALAQAGVSHEVRVFRWTHGKGRFIRDLQDVRHLLDKARELADLVTAAKEVEPDRPVYLIGRSGGAGLVLAAAEQLPPDSLERIVLLSPAVSPAFDLRPALRATRGEIVCFYSLNDCLILGWGTSQFGTVDRVYGPSAGLLGFRRPDPSATADRALYERLVQIPWNSRMVMAGHTGGHFGNTLPFFIAKEVARWLVSMQEQAPSTSKSIPGGERTGHAGG